MRIYLFILSIIISWTGAFAQSKIPYCLVDTVEVHGYLVYRYQKEDVEIHRKYEKQYKEYLRGARYSLKTPIGWEPIGCYWFTTQINNKPGLDLEAIQASLPMDFYERIENAFFPPVSSDVVWTIPEMATCRDTVIIPRCSYYKRTGDDRHLYKFTEVKGSAERYLVKTIENPSYFGWYYSPCVRVPYFYLYFFRWKDKVSLTADTPLDGFEFYWDGKD